MLEEGAAIVDIGGESTRPGSDGVSLDEELRRVIPVLERLDGLPFSIDTAKSEVARRALALGAELVNDVTALRGDPELAAVVAEGDAYLCLMHMQGEPRTMQADPRYDDVASEVAAFLEERLAFAVSAGIPEERVCLDPGIGFGKTAAQNFELIRRLDVLLALGRPVLVGLSRKSSLGKLFDPEARTGTLAASLGAAVAAYERGATIFRVHDVRDHVEALDSGRGGRMRIEITGITLQGRHSVRRRAARRPELRLRRVARASTSPPRTDRRHGGLPGRRRLCPRDLGRHGVPAARVACGCGRRRADAPVPDRPPSASASASRSWKSPRRACHCRRRAMTRAYVGIGAALSDREATIRAAIAALPGVVAVSQLRETDPVGVIDQPRFLNGAARLETDLRPRQLLDALLAIERDLGRERGKRWGPRTIDLDLLLYGTTSVENRG